VCLWHTSLYSIKKLKECLNLSFYKLYICVLRKKFFNYVLFQETKYDTIYNKVGDIYKCKKEASFVFYCYLPFELFHLRMALAGVKQVANVCNNIYLQ
jgi:hypothetical protein